MTRGAQGAAWGKRAAWEPRWPAQLAILAALTLYVILPERYVIGPRLLVPSLILLLLVPLAIGSRMQLVTGWQRPLAVALIAMINAANVVSVWILVRHILFNAAKINGVELLETAVEIWFTNLIVFGLWFWELDRGGPNARMSAHRRPDFLFPQMQTPGCTETDWSPGFFDYLYVAFTNATAFSPTDTLPLTQAAKALMALEALVSIVTVAIVAARAVNIIS
jgi:hypothetical protein